jgi:hypothetical protein
MRIPTFFIVKVGWITAVTAVLAWTLWKLKIGGLSDTLEYEAGLANLILMGALSFPLGPAVLFMLDRAIDVIYPSLLEGNRSAEVILVWTACAVGGYIQWFILFPAAYRKLRKKLQSRSK